jgi:hypothetical protein
MDSVLATMLEADDFFVKFAIGMLLKRPNALQDHADKLWNLLLDSVEYHAENWRYDGDEQKYELDPDLSFAPGGKATIPQHSFFALRELARVAPEKLIELVPKIAQTLEDSNKASESAYSAAMRVASASAAMRVLALVVPEHVDVEPYILPILGHLSAKDTYEDLPPRQARVVKVAALVFLQGLGPETLMLERDAAPAASGKRKKAKVAAVAPVSVIVGCLEDEDLAVCSVAVQTLATLAPADLATHTAAIVNLLREPSKWRHDYGRGEPYLITEIVETLGKLEPGHLGAHVASILEVPFQDCEDSEYHKSMREIQEEAAASLLTLLKCVDASLLLPHVVRLLSIVRGFGAASCLSGAALHLLGKADPDCLVAVLRMHDGISRYKRYGRDRTRGGPFDEANEINKILEQSQAFLHEVDLAWLTENAGDIWALWHGIWSAEMRAEKQRKKPDVSDLESLMNDMHEAMSRLEASGLSSLLAHSDSNARLFAMSRLKALGPPALLTQKTALTSLQTDTNDKVCEEACSLVDSLYAPGGDGFTEIASSTLVGKVDQTSSDAV